MARGVIGEGMAKVADRLAAERDRWALWLPVMFGAGIGFYFALPIEPPSWIGLAGLAAAAGVALWRRPSAQAARRLFLVSLLYLMGTLAAMIFDLAWKVIA